MRINFKQLGVVIVLFLSLLVIQRIFHPGFFKVHDDTQPARVFTMAKSLIDGQFPVRWVSGLGFGYGYPIFNFYAPFPYYVGSIFYLLGLDAITSAKIMFALPVVAAALGMYLFIRSFLGALPGIVSAVIYLFFPYFAVNLFIRGAVGEYYAYSILPYIFWGFFKIYYFLNLPKPINLSKLFTLAGLTSISLALLIISHNLSAYMLGIILVLFLLIVLVISKNKKQILTTYTTIFFFSFLLSAFYTIPALVELNYTDVNSQITGNFNYSLHFICPSQWWESPWGYAGSAPGCLEDGISFRVGKTNIIFTLLAVPFYLFIYIFKKPKSNHFFLFTFFVFCLIFSLFMTTHYSSPVWKLLPKIEFLQFPWRFLNFVGFSMAILIGFLINSFKNKSNFPTIILACFVIAATIFVNLKLFMPQDYHHNTSGYTNKNHIYYGISKITNEYMPEGFIRPKTQKQIPALPLEIRKGTGEITIIEDKTGLLQANIRMNSKGEIQINKAYFPAWELSLNSQERDLQKNPKGMGFKIDPGNHDMVLRFIQTPVQNISNLLTIAGGIALLIAIIIYRERKP
jgi:uncharacterized membrane protein